MVPVKELQLPGYWHCRFVYGVTQHSVFSAASCSNCIILWTSRFSSSYLSSKVISFYNQNNIFHSWDQQGIGMNVEILKCFAKNETYAKVGIIRHLSLSFWYKAMVCI